MTQADTARARRSPRRSAWFLHAALLLAALPACGKAVEKLKARLQREAAPPQAELPPLPPPDPAEVERFGLSLVAASNAGDVDKLAAMVDWEMLMRRATAGLNVPDKVLVDAREGLISAGKHRGIFRMLVDSAQQGGGVTYLKAKSAAAKGGRWAVMRVLQPSGAFDHYSFLLTKRKDGATLAVDWHMLALGEDLSAMLRRMLLPALGDVLTALAARLTSDEATTLKHGAKLLEMQQSTQEGNPKRALEIYAGLPAEAQRLKLFLVTRIHAAQQVDDAALRAAIEALTEHHPRDPSTAIHAIDAYALRGEHRKAVAAIDRLIERGGPDPYFHVLRAEQLRAMKDGAGARSSAMLALEQEPELDAALWSLVSTALAAPDFADAARWLAELSARGAVDLDKLGSAEEFAAFVASEHYERLRSAAKLPVPE